MTVKQGNTASTAEGRVPVREEMSIEEFDERMKIGFSQAKRDQSSPVEEVFSRLIEECRMNDNRK